MALPTARERGPRIANTANSVLASDGIWQAIVCPVRGVAPTPDPSPMAMGEGSVRTGDAQLKAGDRAARTHTWRLQPRTPVIDLPFPCYWGKGPGDGGRQWPPHPSIPYSLTPDPCK